MLCNFLSQRKIGIVFFDCSCFADDYFRVLRGMFFLNHSETKSGEWKGWGWGLSVNGG